jgi:hypothetical protein
LPVALRPGEGPLSDHIAGAEPTRQQPLNLPPNSLFRAPLRRDATALRPRSRQLGGAGRLWHVMPDPARRCRRGHHADRPGKVAGQHIKMRRFDLHPPFRAPTPKALGAVRSAACWA